jgi:hypothetical protein
LGKNEKQAKFDQKNAKKATMAPAATSKSKEKKAMAEKKTEDAALPPYVEDTPAGEKKSSHTHSSCIYNSANVTSSHKALRGSSI